MNRVAAVVVAGSAMVIGVPLTAHAQHYPPATHPPTTVTTVTTVPTTQATVPPTTVAPTTAVPPTTVDPSGVQGAGGEQSPVGVPLARTGADSTVPLIELGLVLIGAGGVVVVAARRRRLPVPAA